jgi:SAM-dependent methyltransferase
MNTLINTIQTWLLGRKPDNVGIGATNIDHTGEVVVTPDAPYLDTVLSDVQTVPTRRSFDEYIELLNINESDLGTTVLDLGSGMDEKFSKEASERNIHVVSLNPKLLRSMNINEAKAPYNNIEWQKKSVAALARNLPFKDCTFDSVVAVESIPQYLEDTYESYYDAFREICRVLKPGGKAFFNVAVYLSKKYLDRYRQIFGMLDKLYGIEYHFPYIEQNGYNLEDFATGKRSMFVDMQIIKRPLSNV